MARPTLAVKDTKIKISDAGVLKLNRAVYGAVEGKIERNQKIVAGRLLKAAHKGAFRAVEDTLTGGVTPFRSGAKNIAYDTGPKGYSGRVRTPAWRSLTEKYARSPPRSRAFWRKHFNTTLSRISPEPRYTLLYLFRQADQTMSLRSSRPREGKISRDKRFKTISWDLTLTFPDNVLGAMISRPFFQAFVQDRVDPGFWYPGDVSRDNISFIVWVDNHRMYGRPFVRQMAFAIGKKAIADMRRGLRQYRG